MERFRNCYLTTPNPISKSTCNSEADMVPLGDINNLKVNLCCHQSVCSIIACECVVILVHCSDSNFEWDAHSLTIVYIFKTEVVKYCWFRGTSLSLCIEWK